MRKYQKPATTIEQQLSLLEERGMELDHASAYDYLAHIGFFRLRGYWIPFDQGAMDGQHQFREGTTFEQVLNLYVFDRELRLLVTDAIERIEVSVRNQWVHTLAQHHGSHGYLKSELYSSARQLGRCIAEISSEYERSKESHIRHYRKEYGDPDLPPIWAVVNIMTLGQFSHWLSNIKSKAIKTEIAKVYGLDQSVLCSFMHHLTVIRNICAHHGRLWNREVTVTMELPRSKPETIIPSLEKHPDPNQAPRQIYNTLVMLAYLMDLISPDNHWKHRLKCIINQHQIDTAMMGFPVDYQDRAIWKQTWEELA